MSFNNDILLRAVQFVKSVYGQDIKNKNFLMLGKQEMHLHEAILDVLYESGLIEDKAKFNDKDLEDSVLFFRKLGFGEVHALDVSDYESADIIFNLNDKLPKELEEKFDLIYDGGVIEHVFDVANAFLNICKMTKVGGYIIDVNPVCNYIHNAFWNISPEMFLDFYSANNYKIVDCSMLTFLAENDENRAWPDRPVMWSPDVRLMSFMGELYPGEHLRLFYKLCSNPHPHTWVIARKTHSRDFIYPIVSGYAKKHRGEQEDNSSRTMKIRTRFDISKVVEWIKEKQIINLYCSGNTYRKIAEVLYKNSLDNKIGKVFDSDLSKLGADIMGRKIEYLNSNTYSDGEILICSEKYADEIYEQLCEKGIEQEKIYRLTDPVFIKTV